jgi:hypothetical protein
MTAWPELETRKIVQKRERYSTSFSGRRIEVSGVA